MSFLRLAVKEAGRNMGRTAVSVAATAACSFIFVLSSTVASAIPEEIFIAERVFVQGDILVVPINLGLEVGSSRRLTWTPWAGAAWQTHLIDLVPALSTRGLLMEEGSGCWEIMDVGDIARKVLEVPGVKCVSPYLALPCIVDFFGLRQQAVLRALDILGQPSHLQFSELVADGRFLSSDTQASEALVPLRGMTFVPPLGSTLKLTVPSAQVTDPPRQMGISWDETKSLAVTVVGAYEVLISGVSESREGVAAPEGGNLGALYWERPEIIVPVDLFREILCSESLGTTPPFAFTYQIAVSVDRIAYVERVRDELRKALGPRYGVFTVRELVRLRAGHASNIVEAPPVKQVALALLYLLSEGIVATNVFLILSQQRRKIGLLRAIGATSRDLLAYVEGMLGFVSSVGAALGFLAGKAFSILVFYSADLTMSEWWLQVLRDAAQVAAGTLGLSLILGLLIGLWACRVPCAEVLSRGP